MNKRAFVLLSGGLDSTTCLHQAIKDYAPSQSSLFNPDNCIVSWVEAISVNYGQRHLKETEYARATCDRFGIPHRVLDLRGILSGDGVMLTDASVPVPNISYDEIKGVSPTYVPFRNGTLLSLITAHAQKWVNAEIQKDVEFLNSHHSNPTLGINEAKEEATKRAKDSVGIYFGAHSEDAHNWAYPDCTPEFIGSMANAIYTGSYYSIRLYTPLQWMMKSDIVKKGAELGVDFKGTWSCYVGGEKHCGVCPTCRSRRDAFTAAGITDPTDYAA